MDSQNHQRPFSRKLMAACFGSFALTAMSVAVVPLQAFAEGTLVKQQSEPTLRGLIETVIVRPSELVPEAIVPEAAEPLAPVSDDVAINSVTAQEVRLRLDLSERQLYVYRAGELEKSYPVAVGRDGWETPTGEFEVFHQITDPGWTNPLTSEVMPPGPDNPLGDRWIAFWTDGQNSIGFHGTPNRESVGQAASHGCIRMYNEDVRELYEIVSVGTTVVVQQ